MTGSGNPIEVVIERNFALLRSPGVLSARAGFLFVNGWITNEPAIVVTVEHAVKGLPTHIENLPVDVRVASMAKRRQLHGHSAVDSETHPSPDRGAVAFFGTEWNLSSGPASRVELPPVGVFDPAVAKPSLPYSPPANTPLTPISGVLSIQLSASPDSGWPSLEPFLRATRQSLTVGLYDFTSAHILATVEAFRAGRHVQLVLDHPPKNPTADQTDEESVAALRSALGSDLNQAWALERADPFATAWIYPSAYHIKVAVRDSEAMWLSSGNFNNSNQPDIDPVTVAGDAEAARSADRDWHVIIESPALSRTFEAFIENDLSIASNHNFVPAAMPRIEELAEDRAQTPPFQQFFASTRIEEEMTLTPLLTPDAGVYVDAVAELIASAHTSLYLQFQYIEIPPTPGLASAALLKLVNAVTERQKSGVDVRIIMSQYESAGYLEQLQAAGLDLVHSARLQNNVHNKGIIVDSAAVLVSSQNWSSAGVFANRDAGVIIHNATAAKYFEQIFLHDWNTLSHQKAKFD